MERTSSASIRAAIALLASLFTAMLYRDATQPISVREAETFERMIYPPFRDVFRQHDAGSALVAAFLTKRSVALLRLSEFSFRLPSLIAAAFYIWAAFRLGRRVPGRGLLLVAATVIHGAIAWIVTPAAMLPLAFWVWALDRAIAERLNQAGLCLGLSVGASLAFFFPALILATAIAIRRRSPAVEFLEQFVFTFIATAFVFLVIPLSTAHSGSIPGAIQPRLLRERADPHPAAVRSLISLLRSQAGTGKIRVAASAGIQPIVGFYRARYRFSNWEFLAALPQAASFDYYVLEDSDRGLIFERHLQVVATEGGLLLASAPRP